MGTNSSEVPESIQTANIQNDPLLPLDKIVILLCPLYSETDYVKRVVDLCLFAQPPPPSCTLYTS